MRRRIAMITALSTAAVLVAACSSSTSSSGSSTSAGAGASSSSASAVSGTVTVFAAASLTEAFTTIAQQFEAAHPGVKVKLSFDASSALATQITQGAPVDVFASASAKNMAQVEIQAGPHRIVSLMSREAADELELEPGVIAIASVKATNVVVEVPENRR